LLKSGAKNTNAQSTVQDRAVSANVLIVLVEKKPMKNNWMNLRSVAANAPGTVPGTGPVMSGGSETRDLHRAGVPVSTEVRPSPQPEANWP
jgi:hypothetical protein